MLTLILIYMDKKFDLEAEVTYVVVGVMDVLGLVFTADIITRLIS